jgi:uncharacterized Tic20 family protein
MFMNAMIVWSKVKSVVLKQLGDERGQFAIDMVIGVVVSVVIAAFVVMPSMEGLFEGMIDSLGDWWTNIKDTVFQSS